MAVTLYARAGSRFAMRVRYLTPDRSEPMETSGYTARLQMRNALNPRRIILAARATEGVTGPLTLVDDGHWRVYLSGTLTKMLPAVSQLEIELVNDDDPGDVITLLSGVINTEPQGTTSD